MKLASTLLLIFSLNFAFGQESAEHLDQSKVANIPEGTIFRLDGKMLNAKVEKNCKKIRFINGEASCDSSGLLNISSMKKEFYISSSSVIPSHTLDCKVTEVEMDSVSFNIVLSSPCEFSIRGNANVFEWWASSLNYQGFTELPVSILEKNLGDFFRFEIGNGVKTGVNVSDSELIDERYPSGGGQSLDHAVSTGQ